MQNSAWLPYIDEAKEGAEVTMITFPHAGANAQSYLALRGQLPSWIDLQPLELPGRGRRMLKSPRWQMEDLVHDIIDAIEPHLGPKTIFFGHSMGGLIAYESTLLLEDHERPVHLIITGHRGPQLSRAYLKGHDQSDAVFAEELSKWAGSAGRWLQSPELRELYLPILRADFEALIDYSFQPASPLQMPLSVGGGQEDPYLDLDGLKAWQELCTGPFSTEIFSGGHFFFLEKVDPLAAYIADKLRYLRNDSSECTE